MMKPGNKGKSLDIDEGFNRDKTIQISKKDLTEAKKQRFDKEDPDEEGAYKMLQDMRWVYAKVKGRKKLLDLVKKDEKQFIGMVRELMKIETALLSAKIRKEGDQGIGVNNNFFVVLKGLEEERKFIDITDDSVDMKQISNALDPEGLRNDS